MSDTSKGVMAVLGAALIWGFSPIFYKLLAHVPPLEVLSHRVLWSLAFFCLVLGIQGRLREIPASFRDRKTSAVIVSASLFIAVNWGLFIWAVQSGLTTQSSAGYYIYPLMSVFLGRLIFGEQLSNAQWYAIALVGVAVIVLTVGIGTLPWVALVLASTFAAYGALKRHLDTGPVVSVTTEVLLVAPIAIVILAMNYDDVVSFFGGDAFSFILLVLSGPMTAVPLILFSYGARRLKMASVGLMLYLNPSLQFACAVFVFSEPFSLWHLVAFSLIWLALAVYSTAAWRSEKARRTASRQASASGTVA